MINHANYFVTIGDIVSTTKLRVANRAYLSGPARNSVVSTRNLAVAISLTVCGNVASKTASVMMADPGPPSFCVEPVQDNKDFARALLDYGQCLLRQSNPAGALAQFRRVTLLSDASAEQQRFANKWVLHLQSRVSMLIIKAQQGAIPSDNKESPVSVVLHGAALPDGDRPVNGSDFGKPQEINPGSYELLITQGAASWKKHICLSPGQTATVHLRVKDDLPCILPRICSDATPPVSPQPTCRSEQCADKCTWTQEHARRAFPVPAAQLARIEPRGELQHFVGVGLVSAGIVSAGFGIGFAAAARSNEISSNNHCGPSVGLASPNACTPDGLALNRAAQTYERAAYWGFGVGAALAVAGVATCFLDLTGKSEQGSTRTVQLIPVVGRESSGLWLQSNW